MKLIILRGIPGAGKSRFIRENYPTAVVASADDGMMEHGVYVFHPSKLTAAHGACLRKAIEQAQAQAGCGTENILVIDNTSITAIEIAPYAAIAQAYDLECEVVTLQIPAEIAGPRNSHGVPQQSVERMAARLDQERLAPWWKKHYYSWNVEEARYDYIGH